MIKVGVKIGEKYLGMEEVFYYGIKCIFLSHNINY
jgi:hypothetical protein